MAQPPAWLRHQAVEASARAMVSITWKKVIGIGLDARSSGAACSRRNSCCLMQLVEQRRRQAAAGPRSRSTAAATAGRSGLGAGDHGRIAGQLGGSRDQRVQAFALRRSVGGAGGQFAVDLLVRLAPGLDAEEIIDHPGHQEPAAEIEESRRNLRQRHVGLEVVAGPDDQGQPDRARGSCRCRRSRRPSPCRWS